MAAPMLNMRGIDAAHGEPDHDANSALMELEKGLRSVRTGEQCEAIVRVPALFEKFPFPILINSALLKLAEVFRAASSNFIRLCVLRVMQQSEKHHDKILNVDDFLKRIFSVIHSNDPVARAITLRTLGSIANMVREKRSVHHSIVVGLDSHDNVEVEAAIFAAERFADKSKTFAADNCGKLADMMASVTTPAERKLKLIPIMQHMYHDASTASKARDVCSSLLPKYPSQKFVTSTLHTMSQLTARTIIDIPQQVDLLTRYLESDPRRQVKMGALSDLRMLARIAPHLWKEASIEVLSGFALKVSDPCLVKGVLCVLTTLSSSLASNLFSTSNGSVELEVCRRYCYHGDTSLSVKAVELLTDIALAGCKKGYRLLVEEAVSSIKTHIVLSAMAPQLNNNNLNTLKLSLRCMVKMCGEVPAASPSCVQAVVSLLPRLSGPPLLAVCESLAAVGDVDRDSLSPVIPVLMDCLRTALATDRSDHRAHLVCLCTLIFQASSGHMIPSDLHDLLLACVHSTNGWEAYKIARQAMRYSQYWIAKQICGVLKKQVASEHYHFWLSGLEHLCAGEDCLQRVESDTGDMILKITQSVESYHRATASLKAAATPTNPLHFQCEFAESRSAMLQGLAQTLQTCNTFRSCPPPAIATALAITNGQEVSRCGQIIQQLHKCAFEFAGLSQRFARLYHQSFDADPVSLFNVKLLQESCDVLNMAILSVLQNSLTRQSMFLAGMGEGKRGPYSHYTDALGEIPTAVSAILTDDSNGPLTYIHIETLTEAVHGLVSCPLGLPRFFFQTLQSTIIKLAISPQPRSVSEPISLSHDTQLTLKVEGIVQHGSRSRHFRAIDKVKVAVTSNLQARSQMSQETKLQESVANDLVKLATPHNDYFSTHFLLSFPVPGIHGVTIRAAILDAEEIEWSSNAQSSFLVKSVDEAYQKQQQVLMRAQQRATTAAHH